jgi:hypothetical protein
MSIGYMDMGILVADIAGFGVALLAILNAVRIQKMKL